MLLHFVSKLIQNRMSKTSPAFTMQDRLVAEIPALPAVWRITFELKRTAEEKFCCGICNSGIITVVGGDLWPMISLPRIAYSCASHDKRRNRTTKAEIDISHQLDGKFSLKKREKELLLGVWNTFDISQEILEFNHKKRLMFKVNIVEFICKVLICCHDS